MTIETDERLRNSFTGLRSSGRFRVETAIELDVTVLILHLATCHTIRTTADQTTQAAIPKDCADTRAEFTSGRRADRQCRDSMWHL